MSAREPEWILKYLTEIEAMAEEILTDKQEIIDLDRRRNKNREAIRELQSDSRDSTPKGKTWLAVGNMFVKMPKEKAKSLLQKDQVQLDVQINTLRSNLKPKVNKLRDLEGEPEIQGYRLKALSKEEMAAVRQVISGQS